LVKVVLALLHKVILAVYLFLDRLRLLVEVVVERME
jgi:hypothetical protein